MWFNLGMYISYLVIGFVIALILLLVYLVSNLYIKNALYESWISSIKTDVNGVYENMKEIDSKNLFEKDDDVGVVYEEVKELLVSLNKRVQWIEKEEKKYLL